MRKLLPLLILLVAISAKATTTLTINVTSLTGGTSPGNSVRIDLQNCAGARVIGTGQVVAQTQTVYPVAGIVTVTLYDNTQIDCGGGKAVSYYSFSYIFQGTIISIGSYNLPPGTFNLADLPPCIGAACIGGSSTIINRIIAGTNITISPTSGTGQVTINAAGGGGGSGSPGGIQTQMQFNQNSSTFGGAKSTTDLATGMQLNTPILNGNYDASKFQTTPTSNNGIANAEAAAGTNGVTVASPNYSSTEVGFLPNTNGTLHDYRLGGASHYATNWGIGTGLAQSVYAADCYFDYNVNATATDTSFCQNDYEVYAGIGNDAGGGVTTVGGDQRLSVMVRNGILASEERVIDGWKDGDTHHQRVTFGTTGLNSDLSREGFGAFMPHFIQEPFVFNSNVVSVTDSTHIKTNGTGIGGAYGTQLGGGWLVNKNNIDSGNITADSAPSGGIVNRRFTTSNTHAVSTAGGATTTILLSPSDFVNGTATSVTVTKKWGTWPASGNVCVSGDHTYETTFSGAADGATVTMLLASRYEEPIGSTIVVGSCTKMFSVPDRLTNSQNGATTSEIAVDIIGAPDANTYLYTLTGVATRDGNALNGSYNWTTDQTIASLASPTTRDASNNIIFFADSGNNGQGYKFMGGRTLTMSGCAVSNFNFGPTAVTVASNGNPFELHFVQPGGIIGASTATGCVLTMTGLNGFTLHKAAKVISASDPTIPKSSFPFTGYYQLGTNTVGFLAGDPVEQPSGNSILIDQISEVAGMTPTNGGQPSIPILDWSCKANGLTTAGQCSGGMLPISIANQAPYSQYKGGGGLYDLMTMQKFSGPWGNYFNAQFAPANGGTFASFGCPPEGCSAPVPWKVFSFGGTASANLSFTPATGLLTYGRNFFATRVSANDMNSFTWNNNGGLFLGPANGATNYNCITFVNNCGNSVTLGADDAALLGDGTLTDKSLYLRFLHGGNIRFQTLNSGFTYNEPCTLSAALLDCSVGGGGGIGTGADAKFVNLTITGTCTGCGGGGGSGVSSIDTLTGAFTFTGSGVSHVGNAYTFSGGGGSGTVASFAAPSGSWPTWLVPTVTNSTTTPSLAVAASAIPNTALANSSITLGSTSVALGATISSAAGFNAATASTLATPRTLAGNSFNGSANIAFANKFIVQGTTDTGLSGAQFLGALATCLLKNTTTTGVLSCGAAGTDYVSPSGLTTTLASPPPIGSTAPNTGAFTTLTATSVGTGATPPTACGSASGCIALSESSAAGTPTAGQDYLYFPSATHLPTVSLNGGAEVALARTIASGTAALGTSAIASGACATVVTATATNTATTDIVSWSFNGDVTAVTGYAPVTTGGVSLYVYPTANTFNVKVCNPTSASITPGAVTLNWRVAR